MSHSHYFRNVADLEKVDVYRILDLFGVTCPVAQHVVKKAIAAGRRGHKSTRRDWQDIAASAARKLEMIDEDAGWTQEAMGAAAFRSPEQESPVPTSSAAFAVHVAAAMSLEEEAERYRGQGGVMIRCPGCTGSCECLA